MKTRAISFCNSFIDVFNDIPAEPSIQIILTYNKNVEQKVLCIDVHLALTSSLSYNSFPCDCICLHRH